MSYIWPNLPTSYDNKTLNQILGLFGLIIKQILVILVKELMDIMLIMYGLMKLLEMLNLEC